MLISIGLFAKLCGNCCNILSQCHIGVYYFTAITICNNNIIKKSPKHGGDGLESTGTTMVRTERLNKVPDFLSCKSREFQIEVKFFNLESK